MRPEELIGKAVIGPQAQIIGRICDMEFSASSWSVSSLCLELNDSVIESLGFKKPRLRGSVKVDLPVGVVRAISDVVSVDKNVDELKNLVKRRQ